MVTPPPSDPKPSAATRALLFVVCVAFVVLTARTSWVLPLFEVPDEFEHYEVAAHYAREAWLPDLTAMPRHALDEGVQPPLAYIGFALGIHALDLVDVDVFGRRVPADIARRARDVALFQHGPDEARPYHDVAWRLHVLRLLNIAPGLATILLTFLLARRVAPHREGLALGAASLVALNPQFGSLCGGITNDPLAIALCTGALCQIVTWCRTEVPSDRQLVTLGLTIGAALIAKLSATFLIPTVGVALLLRKTPTTARAFTEIYLIAIGVLLVSGPWFVWNTMTYGDPLAWELGVSKFGLDRRELTEAPTWRLLTMRYVPRMASTYAARFGATGPGGAWLSAVWLVTAGAASVGLALGAVSSRVRRRIIPARHGQRYALLAAALAANLLASVTFYLSFNQAQGRYLFPTIAPTAVVAALLCATWWRPLWATAGLATLGISLWHAQTGALTAAFWPLNRGHDETFALATPHQPGVPETSLAWLADGTTIESVESPELRWHPPSPSDRFTVRLWSRGFAPLVDMWRDSGTTAHDRYTPPDDLWRQLPPDVPLLAQVQRLATSSERSAGLVGAVTPVRTLKRRAGVAPRDDTSAATLLPAAAPEPDRFEGEEHVPGIRLRVRDGDVVMDVDDGGVGGPPVVCLHGRDSTLDDWVAATRDLRRQRRVVHIGLDHDVELDELARRVRIALETLLVRDAVLVGDERGADVALTLVDQLADEARREREMRGPNAPPSERSPVAMLVLTATPDRRPAGLPVLVVAPPALEERAGRAFGRRLLEALDDR